MLRGMLGVALFSIHLKILKYGNITKKPETIIKGGAQRHPTNM